MKRIEEVLPRERQQVQPQASREVDKQRKPKSMKLPKLEIKKFNDRPEKWQEFWDAYESSIHI